MSNEIETIAEELCKPIIENLGYELVETSYKKNYGENNLTFYIYKKGGITIDDCETVSKAVDSVLDENDVSRGEFYYLNVSSLGLDRPIISEDDYRRSLGEDIEVIFLPEYAPKKKKIHGKLISYDVENITIEEKGKSFTYEKRSLSMVRPYLNFK